MDNKHKLTIKERIRARVKDNPVVSRVAGAVGIGVTATSVQMAVTQTASAEINATTFTPISNLIDAVIPLFTSILDLIIAVFPLIIAMAFLAGLSMLIRSIFDKSMKFK